MMWEEATVVELGDRFVWVEKASSCHGCQKSCLGLITSPKRVRVEIDTDLALNLGDSLWIALDEKAFVLGILCVYCLPLFCFLGFGLIGQALYAAPMPFGIIGFGLSLMALKRIFKRFEFKPFIFNRIEC